MSIESPFLLDLKDDLTKFYVEILTVKNSREVLPRDDYKEIAETALIMLGGSPPSGVSWKKPGAVHKARFMANSLYSNKMFAFQEPLEYDADTVLNLGRFVSFNTFIYTPHFLMAGAGADAPFNDLKLIKSLMKFKSVDEEISENALMVMKRHLGYLSEELVIFSLFSHKVSEDEKSRMAARLLTFEVPKQFETGKPSLPEIGESTELVDLVGPMSWLLFERLDLSSDWLKAEVRLWSENSDFLAAQNFVRTVKTTNDCAERAVKLMTDYSTNLTTKEDKKQQILKVVDNHRKKFNNFDKKTFN